MSTLEPLARPVKATATALARETACSVFLIARNRLFREALSRILARPGDFTVLGAADFTKDVSARLASTPTDIAILDGVTADPADLSLLRNIHIEAPALKIVLIGMDDDEHLFLRTIQAGALGYVLKDASALDVVAAVRAVSENEASCPPHLCLTLFRQFSSHQTRVPNSYLRQTLGLTRREQQLIPLIAEGLTNKEIAARLHLSEQTIKNHIHRMLQKVGASDRLSAVELCRLNTLTV